jgi:small-conductance mechanosensitive channel
LSTTAMLAEIVILPLVLALIGGLVVGAVVALMVKRVPAESPQADVDVESLRAQQAETLSQLRARIADVQAQRDRARAERARLMEGVAEMGGNADQGVTVALSSAREIAEKARQLNAQDDELSAHDADLDGLQAELKAAEDLLAEVDNQREALKQQVKDQSGELWRLREEIKATQHKSSAQRARTMMLTRSNVRKTEVVANRLEDQLKGWVRKAPLNVNFSEHGHASIVRDAFEKLDREFLDRYFSHATNPEYERGRRRAIHVNSGRDPDGTEFGELRIALDDDAGRTLGLRFELKKGAPDAKSVGLVLAMYLRAMNRELRDFEIA